MYPVAPQRSVEARFVPSGFLIVSETVRQPVKVELLICKLTRCPATPSKRIRPILLAVPIATVLLSPKFILPVTSISVAAKGAGGTKKSATLVALPNGVATEIRPDVPKSGTLVEIAVPVAELTRA